MQWMIHNTFNHQHEDIIVTHLRQGKKVLAVSDGSYHPDLKHGTAAWEIRPDDKE